MSNMSHLIVLQFNIILFFISEAQCLTFLPLRSLPQTANLHMKEVTIAFIADYYFVPVTFHIIVILNPSICFILLELSF